MRFDRWSWLTVALFVLLAGAYIYLGSWRYNIFRAGVDDCIFTQVASSLLTGFSSTIEGSVNHFLVHFSPILAIATPFVKVFNGARGLIVLQCLLAAATIFPLWSMAASRLPKWLAFATTLVAATYPPLSAAAVGDFHELAFTPPLAATLVWAVDRKAWRIAIAAAVALAMVKEDQFISLAFIGIAVAVMGRSDRATRTCGLWITSIGALAAALYFGAVRPLVNPHFPYFALHFYEWWRFPATTAGFVAPSSPLRVQYLFDALLPLAFLPLLSRYMLFALPGLAEVLLSHEGITMSLGAHYTATWSGYLLCAFVDGMARVYQRRPVAAKGTLAFALVVSLWTSRYHSPIDPAFALYREPNAADRIRDRELSALPRDASLGSGPWVLPHVAMNPRATVAMTEGEEYLVFDHFTDPSYWIAADHPTILRLTRTREYAQVYNGAGIVVLQRMDR
ncbi:MAG TPA: DUF2079 domain-containing protein [Candidatus Binatia bacterium]|nr:DUF2079 domain-containing protein [Candidatus Binatia bacterium]